MTYVPHRVDTEGNAIVTIDNPTTAFGDMRVAELTPVAMLTFTYNINGDIVTTSTTNGGSVAQQDALAVVSSSTDVAGSGEMRSRDLIHYRNGLGAMTRYTAIFTSGVANSQQTAGVGNAQDGFFFGFNGTSFGILHRKNNSDTWIPQASWNVDPLDGNGPSGMTIDPTKLNVYEIVYKWLGGGQIEFFCENTSGGAFIPLHRIEYSNQHTSPSIYNPSLPLSIAASNTGNNSNIQVKTASMAGFIEGKDEKLGPVNAYEATSSHSSETAIFHLRNKATYLGQDNRVVSFLKQFSVGNDTTRMATFRIYLNATLTGTASWSDVNGDDSVMEVDTAQTYDSGGKLLFAGIVSKDNGQVFDLANLEIDIIPGDVVTITSESANSNDMSAALIWQEDF